MAFHFCQFYDIFLGFVPKKREKRTANCERHHAALAPSATSVTSAVAVNCTVIATTGCLCQSGLYYLIICFTDFHLYAMWKSICSSLNARNLKQNFVSLGNPLVSIYTLAFYMGNLITDYTCKYLTWLSLLLGIEAELCLLRSLFVSIIMIDIHTVL